ncbi:MAG: hypothetical protein NUV61_02120 [Candidatus Azambacteria bacterium]|nr:hypothetical protein [Candidatus Azambacteria bacterium]
MSREEILKMSAGRKMRELVAAQVMGWDETYVRSIEAWHPDENMTDACLVLSELAKEPFSWHIESANLTDGRVIWWVCLWGDMPDRSVAEFSTEAESIPLAICRVALLARQK